MSAVVPLASLLALACFALLLATSNALLPNCAEQFAGETSDDVYTFGPQVTNPGQKSARFHNFDHCAEQNKKLVGTLITACDPLGPPAPDIEQMDVLSRFIICNTDGPCPAGVEVMTSQYCAPL